MKKHITIGLLSLLSISSFTACEKAKHEESLFEETYDRTIKVNESTTFTLPESEKNFRITTDAAHAFVSKIGEDLAGNAIYMYTPEKDYVGSDQIMLSNEEHKASHGHGSNGHHSKGKGGDCGSHSSEEKEYLVTIHLLIEKVANPSTPATDISKSN